MRRKGGQERSGRVLVAGCGGNIGSQLMLHLARMPGIECVTLVDPDVYEFKNLFSQNVTRDELGRPKSTVQAQRLGLLNPEIQVEDVVDHVENTPMGKLRADLIVGCLDNNGARLFLNEISWHLGGIPYVDGGVLAEGCLARVSVYMPGSDSPCLECAWDQRDYDQVEQVRACNPEGEKPASTNSPTFLGALTASLQAVECWKILSGQRHHAASGKQILIDALHHKHYVTRYRRNPQCRFGHEIWEIVKLKAPPGQISLGEALSLGPGHSGFSSPTTLRFAGMGIFVEKLICPACKSQKALVHLEHRLTQTLRACPNCGHPMLPGHNVAYKLEADRLTAQAFEQSLESLGFQSGDIFTISSPSGDHHYEVGD